MDSDDAAAWAISFLPTDVPPPRTFPGHLYIPTVVFSPLIYNLQKGWESRGSGQSSDMYVWFWIFLLVSSAPSTYDL